MSLNQEIEKVVTRAKIRRCPKCIGRLIKIGGKEYDDLRGSNISFHVGRVCKRCNILYIDPRFQQCKVIFSKIGDVGD